MGKITINGKDITKPFTFNGKQVVSITVGGKVCTLKAADAGGITPPAGTVTYSNGVKIAGPWYVSGDKAEADRVLQRLTTTSSTSISSSSRQRWLNGITFIELKGITDIYGRAFSNAPNLAEVYAPDATAIHDSAFFAATLKYIDGTHFPKVKTIGNRAFEGWTTQISTAETIDLPEVESIGQYAFRYCTNVKTINLPKLKKIDTTAFGQLRKVTSLELPELTNLGRLTFWNAPLTHLSLPKLDFIIKDALASNGSFKSIVNAPTTTVTLPRKFNNTSDKTALFENNWDQITFTWV